MDLEFDWEEPPKGIYTGRYFAGRPIKITDGKRSFIITLTGDITTDLKDAGFNLSVRHWDGVWTIMNQRASKARITEVYEVLEARVKIYPDLTPRLQIQPPPMAVPKTAPAIFYGRSPQDYIVVHSLEEIAQAVPTKGHLKISKSARDEVSKKDEWTITDDNGIVGYVSAMLPWKKWKNPTTPGSPKTVS